MPYQADYSKGMERDKPNPLQQRMSQPAPAMPPPGQHPFAKMGGMGARAAMAGQQGEDRPSAMPPPQAPAYGVRARSGAMPGRDMPQRPMMGAPYRMRPEPQGPPPTGMPGGVMREDGGMSRLRRQVGGTDFNPLRERLMGGGTPTPYGNPLFNQMSQGAPRPPIQDERLSGLRERVNQLPYYGGGPTPWATPEYFRQ